MLQILYLKRGIIKIMSGKEKIFGLIVDYIKVNLSLKTIGELKHDINGYCVVSGDSRYDQYTLEQFIVLCKIDELEKKRIISSNIANNLRKLHEEKIEINKKIGDFAVCQMQNKNDGLDRELESLSILRNFVDDVLKQYGLIITNDDYISLLFHNVIENNFNEQRKKDITLESAVKTLEYTLKENN